METVLTAIASALIGGLAGYFAAQIRTRSEFDLRLQSARSEEYPEAWKLTGLLPRRPVTREVSYADVVGLSIALRDWYYGQGGIYLSGPARRVFSNVQDLIESLRALGKTGALEDGHYKLLRESLSEFRTCLRGDLLAGSGPPSVSRPFRRVPRHLRPARPSPGLGMSPEP